MGGWARTYVVRTCCTSVELRSTPSLPSPPGRGREGYYQRHLLRSSAQLRASPGASLRFLRRRKVNKKKETSSPSEKMGPSDPRPRRGLGPSLGPKGPGRAHVSTHQRCKSRPDAQKYASAMCECAHVPNYCRDAECRNAASHVPMHMR